MSRDMVWGDIVPLGHFPEWGLGPWKPLGETVKWLQEILHQYRAQASEFKDELS